MGILTGLSLSLLLLLNQLGLSDGKGAGQINADDVEVFKPEPREPVPASSLQTFDAPAGLDKSVDPYGEYDLAYYKSYYSSYHKVLLTDWYTDMKVSVENEPSTLVCQNHYVRLNNLSLGVFTCPTPADHESFTHCCGVSLAEFCCFKDTYSSGVGIAVFFAIMVGIIIIAAATYLLLGRSSR